MRSLATTTQPHKHCAYSRFLAAKILNFCEQFQSSLKPVAAQGVSALPETAVAPSEPGWYNGSMGIETPLPPPRSSSRVRLLLDDPVEYIRRLNGDDIDALLTSLGKTDGLTQEDIDSIDDGPDWLVRLDRNARE